MSKAILYQADFNRGSMSWREIHTTETTDQRINEVIRICLEKGPSYGFYRFECFDSKGETFNVFTVNCFLFDEVQPDVKKR